jgi:hypothetical protein
VTDPTERALPGRLALAFQPLHKRAFGIAVGLAAGLLVLVATLVVLVRGGGGAGVPETSMSLGLLRQYFYGYSVTWAGALVGFAWGFVVGFTGGWFVAFCRNLVLAVSIFLVRTRAELFQTRDFLDHI